MAQNDHIKIQSDQSAATEAAELINFVRTLRTAYELGGRIRAKMRHSFDDSGGSNSINWGPVETLWGITPASTSTGPTSTGSRVFTFVDGAVGAMEGTFQNSAGKDITETVG